MMKSKLTEARRLFARFQEGEISLKEFKSRLIVLSYDIAEIGVWDRKMVEEFFVPGYIDNQFERFSEGAEYLLSTTSSGSLLQQFEMAYEDLMER